jgi:alpha-methylacyl-CoA racemase
LITVRPETSSSSTEETPPKSANLPLSGATVLDFGTLVPGPMTSLMLAEAGAEVIKIERPPAGDPMRDYRPQVDGTSVHFHALNRGKSTVFVDLKSFSSFKVILPLLERADILIEQFRPGVMDRLGLGYERVRSINPAIIYCSLTGWGQTGPKAAVAAHDLNFIAESGHLDKTCGADGAPVLPPLLAADIAGGVYPAVINILLAYIQRGISGQGTYLDIAIFDGMMAFHYDVLVPALSMNIWPKRGADLVTGGSPRYQLYPTADGRYVAVAAMEDRFWANFCDMIDLVPHLRGANAPSETVKAVVGEKLASRTAAEWSMAFLGKDVCCSVVASLDEALRDPQVAARSLLNRRVLTTDGSIPALPVPIAPQFRDPAAYAPAPQIRADPPD